MYELDACVRIDVRIDVCPSYGWQNRNILASRDEAECIRREGLLQG